ncbi:MAG: fatty acid desaturase [Leptolyngbyaceae cyanobacterium CSU_1_3]|nr:fatty acid desaturase [Leptolyngbyaceae cyanobacterium CSU_1_3]
MNVIPRERWITQAEYAKQLRPLLPSEAFLPDHSKVWVLLINVAILVLGWGIADRLTQWNWYFLWLYLPLTLVMGNSVIVLLFSTHDLLHSRMIKNPLLRRFVGLLGLTLLWTPPTFWKAVHNREHHNKTNSLHDPDRNYLYEQPENWGKWIQNLFVPSAEVHPLWLAVGMGHAWGVHTFRNLTSVLLFNNGQTEYPPASFKVSSKERRGIALELIIILGIHLSIVSYLGFHPLKLILSYFLPIWIGYSGIMFYVYTNHMLCRMTKINDPLINSVSVRVPKLFDLLHFNFSYHTEHHIFPGINSDYYPAVQELLKAQYCDRFNLLDAGEAWRLMLQTPRHYQNENTFTNGAGTTPVPCPLSPIDELIG